MRRGGHRRLRMTSPPLSVLRTTAASLVALALLRSQRPKPALPLAHAEVARWTVASGARRRDCGARPPTALLPVRRRRRLVAPAPPRLSRRTIRCAGQPLCAARRRWLARLGSTPRSSSRPVGRHRPVRLPQMLPFLFRPASCSSCLYAHCAAQTPSTLLLSPDS